MVVDMEDLLLVGGQLRLSSLQDNKKKRLSSNPMNGFFSNCYFNVIRCSNFLVSTNGDRQALNDCTFSATRTAWVLDLSPTVAEPCFTASMAYSI